MQTTFHQYQKLYSTPPWHGTRTYKVSRKYITAFLSYSAKTKCDGQTDRRGALQYLPSQAFGAAGDNKQNIISEHDSMYKIQSTYLDFILSGLALPRTIEVQEHMWHPQMWKCRYM